MSKLKKFLQKAIAITITAVMSLSIILPLTDFTAQKELGEMITVSANTAPDVTHINQKDADGNFYFKNKSVLIDESSALPKGIRFNFGVSDADILGERWMNHEHDEINFKWTIYRSAEGDNNISTGGHLAQYSVYCAVRYVDGKTKAYWGHKYHGSDFLASDSQSANNATGAVKEASKNVQTYPNQKAYGVTKTAAGYMPTGDVINGDKDVRLDSEITYSADYNHSSLIYYTKENDEPMFGIDLLYQENYDTAYFVTMQYEFKNYTKTVYEWWDFFKENGKPKHEETRGGLATAACSTRTILRDIEANGRWEVDFDEYGSKEAAILDNLYKVLYAKKRTISFSWLAPLYGKVNGIPVETPFATKKTVSGIEVYVYGDGALRHNDILSQINQQAARLAEIETGKTEGAEFEEVKKFYETINTFNCFVGLPGEAAYDVQKELLPTTTQNQDDKEIYVYEAVYLPSMHLRLRLSNGTSATSPDHYIDINTSFTEGICKNLEGISVAGLDSTQEGQLKDKMYAYFLNNLRTDYKIPSDIKSDNIYGFWGAFVIPETYFLDDIITDKQIKGLTYMSAHIQQPVSEVNAILANTGRNIISQVWNTIVSGINNWGTNNATLYIYFADPTAKEFGYVATGSFAEEDEGNTTVENVADDIIDWAGEEIEKASEEGIFEWLAEKFFGVSLKDLINGVADTTALISRVGSIVLVLLVAAVFWKLLKPLFAERQNAHKRKADTLKWKNAAKKERDAEKARKEAHKKKIADSKATVRKEKQALKADKEAKKQAKKAEKQAKKQAKKA